MPTLRPRYQITETDEVARALDLAAARWPGEPRSRLIVRLVVENSERIAEVTAEEVARRRAAIDAIGDEFAGMYPSEYLDTLRAEWPE